MATIHSHSSRDATLGPGQMLGRYELLLPIGTGGMGHVWAARLKGSRGFRKLVAIKTILHSPDAARFEQMLYKEATLASQIHHPNVMETLELGEQDDMLYLVMELIQGESLATLMKDASAKGGVPLAVAVNLMGQVAKGLDAAHSVCDENGEPVGLVHRDISPPNILVTYTGTVKIVDFGVATTSSTATLATGEIKGKISYLAPEQLRSEPIDGRVDVFTTGILLYLLTVGRHPFRGRTEGETIARILDPEPALAPSRFVEGYPAALEAVVLRALEKDVHKRYASAAEFLAGLEAALPDAFGPHADARVSEYIAKIFSGRRLERRAMLRVAEELAENTASRDSLCPVPAIVASTSARRRAKQSYFVFAAAAVSLLLALGIASRDLERQRADAARSERTAASAEVLIGAVHAIKPEPGATSPSPAAPSPLAATVAVAPARAVMASPLRAASTSSHPVAHSARRSRTSGERVLEEDLLPDDMDTSESPAAPTPSAEASLASVESGLGVLPASAPAPAISAVESRVALAPAPPQKPAAPALLPSKVAHARLLINPNSEHYRVTVPRSLGSFDRTFRAKIRICVSSEGTVSGVQILESAGPAIDAQIPTVLGRWKYRPLRQGANAVPFCYLLNYAL